MKMAKGFAGGDERCNYDLSHTCPVSTFSSFRTI